MGLAVGPVMVALEAAVVDAAAVMAWGEVAVQTGSAMVMAARRVAGAAVVLVAMKVMRLALAVQGCGGAFDAGRAVGASTAASGWRRMGAAM